MFAGLIKEPGDLVILRYVARKERDFGAKLCHEFFHVLLQAFALIVENQLGARRSPGFGDGPGNAAVVGDAEDDAGFAF